MARLRLLLIASFVITSDVRVCSAQSNKTLAQCGFDDSENCGFVIIPYMNDVHHQELWTLSFGNSLGRNGPASDSTPGHARDIFASSKSLESTDPDEFKNFTTVITTPEMNFTSGSGHISFYYYLWLSGDLEGNSETLSTLSVRGCNGELMWSKRDFMTGWRFSGIDFTCAKPGRIVFEAGHFQPGSGVAIDDVTITETSELISKVKPSTQFMPTLDVMWPSTVPTRPTGGLSRDAMTVVPTSGDTGFGVRMTIIAAACFAGAIVVLVISVGIHCYFWRKRRRANALQTVSGSNGGLHVSNNGYDFLTKITGINNGNNRDRTMATETTTLSTVSKGLGGSSYQMDLISEMKAKGGKLEKREERIPVYQKGRRRSVTLPSFRRNRSGRDRSFEYSEIPDSSSPTDENFYPFFATQGKTKTPKLAALGRSTAMTRSNSLPSRKSTDSTGLRFEGPYQITDLIGNVAIDVLFPSVEDLKDDNPPTKRVVSAKYDQPQSDQKPSRADKHEYKSLDPRKTSDSYDVLQPERPKFLLVCREQSDADSRVRSEPNKREDPDDYNLLVAVSPKSKRPPRDLAGYENAPPPVSPKPKSPYSPQPKSPRWTSQTQLPAVVQHEASPQILEQPGPDGFVYVRDPKYYTLVPDLVRDASYEYPAMTFDGKGNVDDSTSDLESNVYESFERPATPKDRKHSVTQNSQQVATENNVDKDSPSNSGELLAGLKNHPMMVKKQQLAKFLEDDYENIK